MNKHIAIFIFMAFASTLTACSTGEDLTVEVPATPNPNPEGPKKDDDEDNASENEMTRKMTVNVDGHSFAATLEDNPTARAFAALLPMTVMMEELNGNEKYHYLSENLPADSYRPETIHNGDLMLYGSSCIVLFYKTCSTSYSYTRIGRIDNPSGLADTLGESNATITFTSPV